MRESAFRSFRVKTSRAVRTFPFTSGDVDRQLGARILAEAAADGRPVRVDLANPEATCFVEVTPEGAFVYTGKEPGIGGLPTGASGRLLCLLSGGLDSAVAAYKILRRGVRVCFVHFYGEPARAGEDSPPIARAIVRQLTLYQGLSRLFLTPFGDVQREILVAAPDEFRLLLYRRFMLRIAERVARASRCRGAITGDSIAQVASQTLPNMQAVSAGATMPIYRPLAGDDKVEIVRIAREIGTFDISSEPFADCCPMYLPRNPRVFSNIEELNRAEQALDVDGLVERSLSQTCRETYEYVGGEVRLRSVKHYAGARQEAETIPTG